MNKVAGPSGLSFTGSMKDLQLYSVYDHTTLVLTATHSGGTITLLSETYWPDSDSNIYITELGTLLEPYCRQYGSLTVSVTVKEFTKDSETAATENTYDLGTVIFGEVDPLDSNGEDMEASDFVNSHFLSILTGEKITAMGRHEMISAYGAQQLTVSALLKDGSTFTEKGSTLGNCNSIGSIYDFDVSPDNIYDLVGGTTQTLVTYTVSAGDRKQTFRCIEDQVPPSPSFVFKNSFGCWEYAYCTGTHTKTSDYTRTTAKIGGKTRNYKVEEARKFKANTGALNRSMAAWFDDLFRSQAVYLFTDTIRNKDVIITDSKSEISNDDDDMPSFEFTWQYAQRLHNILESEKKRVRVFDNTFDYTFE